MKYFKVVLLLVTGLLAATEPASLSDYTNPLLDPVAIRRIRNYEQNKGVKSKATAIPSNNLLTAEGQQFVNPLDSLPTAFVQLPIDPENGNVISSVLPTLKDSSFGSAYDFSDNTPDKEAEAADIGLLDDDYHEVLAKFKRIGCFGEKGKTTVEQALGDMNNVPAHDKSKNSTDPYSLCSAELAQHLMDTDPTMEPNVSRIFKHFKEMIYRPLGYKVNPQRFSYTDVIKDLVALDERSQTIRPNLPLPTTGDFQKSVLGTFAEIENFSADFENNRSLISQRVIDLLKQFHIFWNVLRQRKQLDASKSNTFMILSNIIKKYRETSQSMRATTISVLNHVRDAYFRFIRAHKLRELIKKNTSSVLVYQILRRYKANAESLRVPSTDNTADAKKLSNFVHELSIFLDLLRSFFIVNYRSGMTDEQSLALYKSTIYERIKGIFETYSSYMETNSDPSLERLRDFTATLLLKMEHRVFIVVRLYTVQGYINRPLFEYDGQYATSSKVFYELMDGLMEVPGICKDFSYLRLESCVREKTFSVVESLYNKYQLFTSVSGSNLHGFITESCTEILDEFRIKKTYVNFVSFRNSYFAQIFRFSENYREQYKVNDMAVVDELEASIGNCVEKAKGAVLSGRETELVESLDGQLYELFLKIKSDYNRFAPLNQDSKLLNEIAEKVSAMTKKFQSDNFRFESESLKGLQAEVQASAKRWVSKHTLLYAVRAKGANVETPASQVVALPAPGSEIVHTFVSEPQMHSGMAPPTYRP